MHFAWQFSVSFTCAASGRIFDGKNFAEKLLPSQTRGKYKPENDIQHSSDGPAKLKIPTIPKRPVKIIQSALPARNALSRVCSQSAPSTSPSPSMHKSPRTPPPAAYPHIPTTHAPPTTAPVHTHKPASPPRHKIEPPATQGTSQTAARCP